MLRHKQTKIRFFPHTSNGPPTPTTADTEINNNDELSIAIKATKDKLQILKEMPISNLQQILEWTMQENGQFTLKLWHLQQKYHKSMYVVAETKLVIKSLQ